MKRETILINTTQLNISGNTVQDPQQILNEQKVFYEHLYSDKDQDLNLNTNINAFLNQLNIPKLTTDKREHCELKVDCSECSKALKDMKNSKTPGIDGLPADFCKFFWTTIKIFVVDSINYSFHTGEMSSSQRLGIIMLLPKKDKDRMFLKNWRPLSILCTDYKLISKMLALRLSNVLPSIINSDQTAYIKGRYIGENIRTVSDIVDYCKAKNMTSVLLLIDFEKAFDTVNWIFLHKTLSKFNLGDTFKKWIKLLYNNIQSTVINNGYFSPYFNLRRGVRQGCPISAYLFLLVVETLAISIRSNKYIQGINVKGKEI